MVACERAHVQHLLPYVVLGRPDVVLRLRGRRAPGARRRVARAARARRDPFNRPAAVSAAARRIADATADEPEPPDADAASWLELSRLSSEAVSPLARTEHALLPWVNLFALPLFALANAGVRLSGGWWSGRTEQLLIVGLVAARLFGKAIGIVGAGLLAKRWRPAALPEGVGLRRDSRAWRWPPALRSRSACSSRPAPTRPGSTLLAAARVGVLLSVAVCGVVADVLLRAQSSDGEPR